MSKKVSSHSMYTSKEIPPPRDEYWAARRSVANALRALQEAVQTTGLSTEELLTLSASLKAQHDTLPTEPRLFGRKEWLAAKQYGGFGVMHTEVTPIMGGCNPLSPGLSVWFEGDKVYGTVTYGWMYEGVDSIAHGGWVAAVFDEFMGAAQALSGKVGMTASLTTQYHKPTPLNKPLTLEARLEESDGRKTRVHAEMKDGDTVTASCQALFVLPGHKNVSQVFD
jgi:hypothetical protein